MMSDTASGAAAPIRRRPGETAFALALVLFSLAALWRSYGISGFSGLSTAGVFPMLASGTMTLASLVVLGDALRRPSPNRAEGGALRRFFAEVAPPRVLGVVALIALYVGAMPWLGFMLASAGFLFLAFWALWRRGPLISLALTVAALLAIHLLFRRVFQVVLPEGSLIRGSAFEAWLRDLPWPSGF